MEGTNVGYCSWRDRAILFVGSVSVLMGLDGTALPAVAAQGVQVTTAPPPPVLNWQPCANPLVVGFECATAKVPLDYTDAHGSIISLPPRKVFLVQSTISGTI